VRFTEDRDFNDDELISEGLDMKEAPREMINGFILFLKPKSDG
jgi:hypothetical protein